MTRRPPRPQVRVRVVEGRRLMGGNMNPVCRVSLDGDAKQTRVHRGTSSPWFDEIFFYQLEKLPSELLEDFLEFQVRRNRSFSYPILVVHFRYYYYYYYSTLVIFSL